MDLVRGLAIIYVLALLVFTLGFLINWYRNREAMSEYKRIGFWAGIIFVIFELLTLALSRGAFLSIGSMCLIVAALGWGFLRMWGFVNNGIFFSNKINIRSFPLIAPRLGIAPVPVEVASPVTLTTPAIEEPAATTDMLNSVSDASLTPINPPAAVVAATPNVSESIVPPDPAPISWSRYLLTIVGVGVGAVAYSAVLFLITQPRPGLIAQNLLSSDVEILTPLTLVIILEFAFAEELIFRLGIQNYLGAKLIDKRYGYAIAVALTAALWSMAHVGSLDPDWVKLAQIFPLGLALGWLYRRQGTESTIMAHALFNLLGGLLLSPLYLR